MKPGAIEPGQFLVEPGRAITYALNITILPGRDLITESDAAGHLDGKGGSWILGVGPIPV